MTKQEQFFYDNAGTSYTPAKETQEQGKVRGALALAHAETLAASEGFTFEWHRDEMQCIGCDCGSGDCACCEGTCEPECCIVRNMAGEVVGSLSGICGATREYRRVVQAELAVEALPVAEVA